MSLTTPEGPTFGDGVPAGAGVALHVAIDAKADAFLAARTESDFETYQRIRGSIADGVAGTVAVAPTPSGDVARGWTDARRGVNDNLGDTESALHLFYLDHPALGNEPPSEGTPDAAALDALHLGNDAKKLAAHPDAAQTGWSDGSPGRSIAVTDADRAQALSIYSAQHPELGGKAPAPGTAAARSVKSLATYVAQNKYNATIDNALEANPTAGIDAKDVKSLLIQESNLNPHVGTNAYGYTGIAQLSSSLAPTKVANDPLRAIPIAVNALHDKAAYLDAKPFAAFGQPADIEDRKSAILGSYNGGQGTISTAMQLAYTKGREIAREKNLTGERADAFAKDYATKWSSLLSPTSDISKSPLYNAIPAAWGRTEKYHEIGSYATDIVSRAEQ